MVYNGGDMLEDVDGIFKETAVQKLWGGMGRCGEEKELFIWLSTG